MQTWLKRSLLVLAVFGACWLGAIWYWRSTTRMPDTGDLALAMLVMPLVLLSAVWMAGKSLAAARAAQAPGANAGQPAAGAAQESGAPAGQQAQSPQAAWQPLAIAATALRMAHGDSPAALAAAMGDGAARLDLDPELTDLEGFPILAGRVPGVDTQPLCDWLAGKHPEPAPHLLRAIALGGEVCAQLAAQAEDFNGDAVLQLLPLLPAGWPAAAQELATAWLVQQALDAGWPQERLALRHPAPGAQVSLPVALRDLARQAADASAPAFSMLLAFDSGIGQAVVEELAVSGKLYGRRTQNGRMPAEGAAGVLLQPARLAQDALRLLALADGAPGQQPPPLTALAQDVLAQSAAGPVDYVAADTDHRAAAMADLLQCVEAHVPALETDSGLACVGASCGHTGTAGALAALALAHEQAFAGGGYALCLANSEAHQRFALLVGPAPVLPSSAPTLS